MSLALLLTTGGVIRLAGHSSLTPQASALSNSNTYKSKAKDKPKTDTKTAPTPSPTAATPKTTSTVGDGQTQTTAYIPAPLRSGVTLYGSPGVANTISAAAQAAQSSDSAILQRLAAQPVAAWFGDWNSNVQADVNSYVSGAAVRGAVPVLVAYNIPNRDCGGQSAGGTSDAVAYHNWIQAFAAGVGGRSAIVVLEPDAVASDCFSAGRASMLADAIQTIRASSQAIVYLDAGNPTWHTPADIAARLNQSGITNATGFSLNVSNFQTTESNIAYGNQVAPLVGGRHFVIDTSRNGNGPTSDAQWCNPDGRALGRAPTTQTGYALADAFLWIKVPGESDGTCGPPQSGTYPPTAGTFWPQYALMLARNAGW